MVRTTKISIAIDRERLRLARLAAKAEGLSLSGYIARALGNQLADQRRLDAARELYQGWDEGSVPTQAEREAFLARMARPRRRRARKAA